MDSPWLIVYLVLVSLAVAQGVALGVQVWEHRRYGRSCMGRLDRLRPRGRAAVLAPCKGVDVDLAENLQALLCQDYDDYEVVFLVESADDPAVEVIRRVAAEQDRVEVRLAIAGRATTSGQKVHNLRCGAAAVSAAVEYLAFIDSDARARPEWLRVMIAQLCEHDIGAVTGYRWFTPTRDSLANHLLYSLNGEIMSLLGRSSHYLIWGGSWGIRRTVFESIHLRSAWEGTLSDDLVASRQLRRARRRVRFEPACVVASPLDCSMREMFSFVRRQYVIARCYVPDWWAAALGAAALASLVWLSNLAVLVGSLVAGTPPVWIPAGAIGALYLIGVIRGRFRQDLLAAYFPERQQGMRWARRFDVWAGPLARFVHRLGVLSSLFGRRITWRGITYRVFPGGQIRIAGRREEEGSQETDNGTLELVRYRKAG